MQVKFSFGLEYLIIVNAHDLNGPPWLLTALREQLIRKILSVSVYLCICVSVRPVVTTFGNHSLVEVTLYNYQRDRRQHICSTNTITLIICLSFCLSVCTFVRL